MSIVVVARDKKPKRRRSRCSRCGEVGHNIRNCTQPYQPPPLPPEDSFFACKRKLDSISRKVCFYRQKRLVKRVVGAKIYCSKSCKFFGSAFGPQS